MRLDGFWFLVEVQRLEITSFNRSEYDDLKEVAEIKFSLFLVDLNFEKLEFERRLLDQKTILLQEENPGWALFLAPVISVNHTPIFYVGVEVVSGVQHKGNVLGMRVV